MTDLEIVELALRRMRYKHPNPSHVCFILEKVADEMVQLVAERKEGEEK